MAVIFEHIEKVIRQGLQSMGIALEEKQIQTLLSYLLTLHRWNKVYNLSAIRDPAVMATLHLLDSLALVPYLRAFVQKNSHPIQLIDVGSGGGLPGLPLAIACPEATVTLLDSNGKKTRFLFQTALELGLKNTKVVQDRVEKFSPGHKFSIVTSRAFSSIGNMLDVSNHLLEEEGEFWAMKGVYPAIELSEYREQLDRVHRLQIPGCEGERHLLILKKYRSNANTSQ
ncbi:MAG: 16S rRNA (guanine527-N7)-methyltransferase [Cellvibrionaceae bacterium]|jgi:16S rRNA (guanine527-N7)-methyltransferase